MNAHKAIAARLAAFAGLTALVPAARITPSVAKSPATRPYIVWFVVHTQTERGSTSDPAFTSALFQVDCYHDTALGARTVAAQVMLALDRWRQTSIAGVTVDDCIFVSDMDQFEPLTMTHSVSADFRLYYRE